LAIHYAIRTDKAPELDGRLDEPCWKASPEFAKYVRMYGENYQPTSIRVVWGDAGIYFGIVNGEKHLDRLKVSVRTRDGGAVWADDSAEIYLDPTATGYSMFKFDINSIGTIGDFWQVDMGFTDTSWSASSAKAICGRTEDGWTIEFFVSWADLKKTPHPGDVWMMMHQRFSYTADDAHRCAVSTSGGGYYNRKFGFIYFVDKQFPDAEKVGQALLKFAVQPWVLPLNGDWLYAEGGKVEKESCETIIARLRERAEASLDAVSEILEDAPDESTKSRLDALRKRFEAAEEKSKSEEKFSAMAEFQKISLAAEELRYEAELAELLK
jgi:hypothetical protein